MANYLKLNKSYIGNDLLENPEFNMLGPEEVLNADFSQSYPSTVPDIEGVMFNNWTVENGLGGSSYRLEAIPNGYKQTLITLPTAPGSVYLTRLKQDLSSVLEVGKVYKISYEIKGSSNYIFYNSVAKLTSQDTLTSTPNISMGDNQETIKVEHEFAVTDLLDSGNNPVTVGQHISFYMSTNAQVGDWIEVTNITLKEIGQVEYSPDPLFSSATKDTSVSALSGWGTWASPVSNNVISSSGKYVLEIVTNGPTQGAWLSLADIPDGMEVNIKIESVTGDVGILLLGGENIFIPTESGFVDFTFVKKSNINYLYFGVDGAGTTNYYNITVRPTNVFAYGWQRNPNEAQEGVTFSNNNVTMAGQFTKIKGLSSSYPSGTEVLLKFDVLSFTEGVNFRVSKGAGEIEIKDLKLGENELRYTTTASQTDVIISTSNDSDDYEITLDSISVQEVKNQPKLIGVDNVSTVSAPTNSTVVINNGLTDGADTITITYAEADASSTVQMRNFFQDAIVESANANNTGKVIEIKSPVLINDIVAS